jgi:hypothetical protein
MEDRILCEFISKNIDTSNNIIGQERLTNSYHHLKSNSSFSINSINNYSPVNKRIYKSKKERTFSLSNSEQLINEDNKKSEKIILFGIFDGHGGFQISSKLVEILPKEIHSRINNSTNENNIKFLLIFLLSSFVNKSLFPIVLLVDNEEFSDIVEFDFI